MDTPLEISPEDVSIDDWDHIIDVRPHARSAARIPGSEDVSLDEIVSAGYVGRVLVVCDIGMRSRLAALALRESGIDGAMSLAGGIDAWRAAGRSLEHTGGLTTVELDRYDRQIKLPGFGVEGQTRLTRARVTLIGAGGLGSPILSYLGGAGVGSITIVDDDEVAISNLHRQPVFSTENAGGSKADLAEAYVERLNPSIDVTAVKSRVDRSTADELIGDADIVIDATDNFPSRYTINDACVRLGVPLVTGAVYRYEGQMLSVAPGGPCYRCAFPSDAGEPEIQDCSIVGVLGSVVGTIGSMMATTALRRLIAGATVDSGVLTVFDGISNETMRVRIQKRTGCPACGE